MAFNFLGDAAAVFYAAIQVSKPTKLLGVVVLEDLSANEYRAKQVCSNFKLSSQRTAT